jgi:hypothetical protein
MQRPSEGEGEGEGKGAIRRHGHAMAKALRSSASTTACSKILLQSPKFLSPQKLPCNQTGGKNQENSGKFEANVSQLDPTRNRASLHCLKIACLGKFFKSSLHERICSTYMFMFVQGRKVLDNGSGVEWQKVLKFLVPRSPEMAFTDSSVPLLLELYYL